MPTLLSSLPAGTKSTSSETGAVLPSTVFAFVLLSSTENSGWLFSGSDWSLSSPEVISDSSLVVSDTSAPVLSSVKSDDSPSPFQRLGLLLPLAGEAARAGDRAMLEVFARGGEMLARQTLALIDRHPEFRGSIVICGGAWKAHPATFERFSAIVGEKHPSLPICRPWFEHVLAGPMDMLLRMGFAPEDAHARLLETFPDYEWRA